MKLLIQDRSEFNLIFVHSELDDLGLDCYEFRIYAHLARRANSKSRAWPGITSMSHACRMKRNTVIRSVRGLELYGMIRVKRRSGGLSEYFLTAPSEWQSSSTGTLLDTGIQKGTGNRKPTSIPNGTGTEKDTGAVSKRVLPPVPFGILKGNPSEGNPVSKSNTAQAPETPPISPSSSSVSPTNALEPAGRVSQGSTPAMLSPISKNKERKSTSASQSNLELKAYAIARNLADFHWDNCKVSYSKYAARSYALKALNEGYDETRILACYLKALRHCHGVITDEMDRRVRSRTEKATPALTVWLAGQMINTPGTLKPRSTHTSSPHPTTPNSTPKNQAYENRRNTTDRRTDPKPSETQLDHNPHHHTHDPLRSHSNGSIPVECGDDHSLFDQPISVTHGSELLETGDGADTQNVRPLADGVEEVKELTPFTSDTLVTEENESLNPVDQFIDEKMTETETQDSRKRATGSPSGPCHSASELVS